MNLIRVSNGKPTLNTSRKSYNNIGFVNFAVRGLWHFVMPKFNMFDDVGDPFDYLMRLSK